jgi:hypothetical protein
MGSRLPPVNRIIAFAGPYIAIVSGALADWLIVHVHFLALFHTSKSDVTGLLTQALVFGLTSILVWIGQSKWLSGWQRWENTVAGSIVDGPDLGIRPEGVYSPSTLPPE